VVQVIPASEDEQDFLEAESAILPAWLAAALVCPTCKKPVEAARAAWTCHSCNRTYPVRFGVPDFRLNPDPYISIDDEVRKIEKLFAGPRKSFEQLLAAYYELSPENPPVLNRHYVTAMQAAVTRGRALLSRIRSNFPSAPAETLLDLGCGTGGLLVSAPDFYPRFVGADVALRWLLIGRQRLLQADLDVPLICCNAEFLPFAPGTFSAVTGDAVLEHVSDVERTRDETLRVLAPGGSFFFVTNNRYSILPEPHLRIPAFGLLPRRMMEAVAMTLRKTPYKARLMSVRELGRIFRSSAKVALPTYAEGELGPVAEPMRRRYAAFSKWSLARKVLWPVVPQYFISGSKAETPTGRLSSIA